MDSSLEDFVRCDRQPTVYQMVEFSKIKTTIFMTKNLLCLLENLENFLNFCKNVNNQPVPYI